MSSSAFAGPAVRATFLKMVLARLDELWPEDAAAARAALGPEALAHLDRTPGLDWIPLAYDVTIIGAVRARRGDEGVRQLGREVGRAAVDHPLLRPLLTATLGMLGRRPQVLVDVGISGWAAATRGAGRLEVASRAGSGARIAVTELPEVMRDRGLLLRMGGAAESLLALAQLRTDLAVEWEPGAPRAVLALSWSRER